MGFKRVITRFVYRQFISIPPYSFILKHIAISAGTDPIFLQRRCNGKTIKIYQDDPLTTNPVERLCVACKDVDLRIISVFSIESFNNFC